MNHILEGSALLAQQGSSGSPLGSFLPLILMVGVFYFILIRPQQRRAKEHRDLVSAIQQGDRVVAAGGIVGTVRRVDDTTIALQVGDNVVLTVDRSTVARKID